MKRIAVIGSGVVGNATGKGFIAKGHTVIFYDIRDETIKALKEQRLDARYADQLDVNGSDVFFLTVPTPTEKGEINLKHMEDAARNLGKKLKERKDYSVVVVRSTVLPKMTEDLVIPILEKESGRTAGKDFGVAMNPEYLREKHAEDDFAHPWLVTIGSLDQKSKQFMLEIFQDFQCPIHHLSLREAETQKYVHNLYNAVKIAFFNEMRMVCEHIDIAPDKIFEITAESAEGSWNKTYGIRNLGPFDGMCLPKDAGAFLSWSKQFKLEMDVLDGALRSNRKFETFWEKMKEVRRIFFAKSSQAAYQEKTNDGR